MCGWLEHHEGGAKGPTERDIATGKATIEDLENATPWKRRWAVLANDRFLVYDPKNQLRPRFELELEPDIERSRALRHGGRRRWVSLAQRAGGYYTRTSSGHRTRN